MKHRAKIILSVFVFAATCCACVYSKEMDHAMRPREDIQVILRSLLSKDPHKMFDGTEAQFQEKLSQLKAMVNGQDEELVMELAFYSMQAKDMREAMLAGVIIEQLGISKQSIAKGAVPLLKSEDNILREKAYELLNEVDSPEKGTQPDFSAYTAIIRDENEHPSSELIHYMYSKDAEAALLAVASAYSKSSEADDIIHTVKSNNNAAILNLAADERWWVRLYVAVIMNRSPELRNDQIYENIRNDAHPLVREATREVNPK